MNNKEKEKIRYEAFQYAYNLVKTAEEIEEEE